MEHRQLKLKPMIQQRARLEPRLIVRHRIWVDDGRNALGSVSTRRATAARPITLGHSHIDHRVLIEMIASVPHPHIDASRWKAGTWPGSSKWSSLGARAIG